MEGFENPVVQETDLIRRNEKLRSAEEVIKNLFESIEDNAIKKIMKNPAYENLSDRT